MKTYAELAERLGRKQGKYEALSSSPIKADKNTAERMAARIKGRLDMLFNVQEMSKPVESQQQELPQFAFGGEDLRNVYSPYMPTPMMSSNMPFTMASIMPAITSNIEMPILTERGIGITPEEIIPTPTSDIDFSIKSTPFSRFPLRQKSPTAIPLKTSPIVERPVTQVDAYKSKWDRFKGSALEGIGQFGEVFGPELMNWAATNSSIKRMKGPQAPIYAPMTKLNPYLAVGAQEAEIGRSTATMNRNAQQFAPNAQAATAGVNRAAALGIQGRNQLADMQSRYANQVNNQQAGMNAQTNMQNTMLANNFMDMQNDFYNNKQAAMMGNNQNLFQNSRLGLLDRKREKLDIQKFLMSMQMLGSNVSDDLYKMAQDNGIVLPKPKRK